MSIIAKFQVGVVALTMLASSSQLSFAAGEDAGFKSSYSFPDTIERLKHDIQDKGIMLFNEIDQATLAAGAGIALHPSTLLVFGTRSAPNS